MTLLIAEGPSYTFHCVADSHAEADRQFRRAWKKHVEQTGANKNYREAVTINYVDHMSVNVVYRDYEKFS